MKKIINLFLVVCLLIASCSACSNPNTPNEETTEPPSSPVSDFEYQVRDEGGIEITKYIGTDDHVVIPQTIDNQEVVVIGKRSFDGTDIVSVVMPDTVIYISPRAFLGCENLIDVKMSDSLITVGEGAFINCTSLTSVDLSAVKYIDHNAFYGCQSLKTVKFGDNVQMIRDQAFYECVSLEEAILPKNLQEIGLYAFGCCSSIRKIWIPKTLEDWGWAPFTENNAVTEIVFEDGLKRIGSYCGFGGCQVEALQIPASVEYIAGGAFAMPDLKEVYFDGAAPEIGTEGEIFTMTLQEVKIYYNPSMPGWDTTPLRDQYTLIPLS